MLEAIRRHHVTATFAVPGMLTRLADLLRDSGDDRPLPLRHTLYGGAPIGVEEIRRLLRTLGPSLIQLYGRFEAGWPLTVLGATEHQRVLHGEDGIGTSAGRAIPDIELALREVAGQPGAREICTRNEMVSPDYADPDGWCALGDLATTDEDGYIYLAGRMDNMINTGSYHVYPGEVEEAIAAHPGVAQVRVLGEPDPVWGQAVTAYVVASHHAPPDLVAHLHEQLGTRLARYKIPKRIHLVDQL
jgi:acyl-CoA synthetase (AMP-forming)/AMP-acid ligase II